MITYEELFITGLYLIGFAIVSYFIYKMIINSKELKYKNLSISKIEKELKKRIEKSNKKHKIKKKK